MNEIKEPLDLQFSGKGQNDKLYKTPKDMDISWWYICEFEDFHKEGITISIHTKNNNYDIDISTETLVDMLRSVVETVTGTPISISFNKQESV